MKKIFGLSAILLWSASAFATTWSEKDSFWVTYEFSANAFGKSVASVMVHTGVLRQGGDSCGGTLYPGYWDDVHDVVMTRTGDHFFAKARLDSGTGECQIGVAGPIVQYWLTFTDGSKLITDSIEVPYSDTPITVTTLGTLDWDRSTTANDQAFASVTDANATSATRLRYSWAD